MAAGDVWDQTIPQTYKFLRGQPKTYKFLRLNAIVIPRAILYAMWCTMFIILDDTRHGTVNWRIPAQPRLGQRLQHSGFVILSLCGSQ
jgi:hypothetical protein